MEGGEEEGRREKEEGRKGGVGVAEMDGMVGMGGSVEIFAFITAVATTDLAVAWMREVGLLGRTGPGCTRAGCEEQMREVKDSSRGGRMELYRYGAATSITARSASATGAAGPNRTCPSGQIEPAPNRTPVRKSAHSCPCSSPFAAHPPLCCSPLPSLLLRPSSHSSSLPSIDKERTSEHFVCAHIHGKKC